MHTYLFNIVTFDNERLVVSVVERSFNKATQALDKMYPFCTIRNLDMLA